jgi:hypothetical protein
VGWAESGSSVCWLQRHRTWKRSLSCSAGVKQRLRIEFSTFPFPIFPELGYCLKNLVFENAAKFLSLRLSAIWNIL